eukprot:RCo002774
MALLRAISFTFVSPPASCPKREVWRDSRNDRTPGSVCFPVNIAPQALFDGEFAYSLLQVFFRHVNTAGLRYARPHGMGDFVFFCRDAFRISVQGGWDASLLILTTATLSHLCTRHGWSCSFPPFMPELLPGIRPFLFDMREAESWDTFSKSLIHLFHSPA